MTENRCRDRSKDLSKRTDLKVCPYVGFFVEFISNGLDSSVASLPQNDIK